MILSFSLFECSAQAPWDVRSTYKAGDSIAWKGRRRSSRQIKKKEEEGKSSHFLSSFLSGRGGASFYIRFQP